MSNPEHFDHLLPFLHPYDIHHKIDLTPEDIMQMHSEDGVEDPSIETDMRTRSRHLPQRPGESKPGQLKPGESVPKPAESEKRAASHSQNPVSGEKGSRAQTETEIGDLKSYKKRKRVQDIPVSAEIEFL